jgi:hypothetical protein
MRQLSIIRLAVLIFMRDLVIPGAGVFLAVYLSSTGKLSPWHLPLIAGMLGTPLVARGGMPSDEELGRDVLPPGTEALPKPTDEEKKTL